MHNINKLNTLNNELCLFPGMKDFHPDQIPEGMRGRQANQEECPPSPNKTQT